MSGTQAFSVGWRDCRSALTLALQSLAALRRRQTWVLLHRWVGLVISGFLIVAGVTGILLVWLDELDAAVAPEIYVSKPPTASAAMLDGFTLREKALSAVGGESHAWISRVPLNLKPDRSVIFYAEGPTDPVTGEHQPIPFTQIILDPYTGKVLNLGNWGALSEGPEQLMAFIYKLHYSLALGTVGTWAFGIVAILWTIDSFVGAGLTLPSAPSRPPHGARSRSFWTRWRPAWIIRRPTNGAKLSFDLHRAGGLWFWAMLFIFAWSSVGLNLYREVYDPLMRQLIAHHEPKRFERLAIDQAKPGLDWRDARAIARVHMDRELERRGHQLIAEESLYYDPHYAQFSLYARTTADSKANGRAGTYMLIDANSGVPLDFFEPGMERAGDWLSRWLFDLHMARVWGLPYRLFVTLFGVVVVLLSITGILIWARKRRARLLRSQKPFAIQAASITAE